VETIARVSPERFAEGMSIKQFIKEMQKNRELFEANYNDFTLNEEDEAFFRSLDSDLKVMVLAEDWCGDVLRYLPVFTHIAEVAPGWDVRVFKRDDNTDLADQCLKEGKYRAIPVFKFFDKDLNEITCFTERPAAVYEMEANLGGYFAAAHPELPDAVGPLAEMSETTHTLYVEFVRAFRAENRKNWQQMFVDEIKGKLQAALPE
jgi:thiol-disulfide isomerase/thioredoxin